ncbi:chemotaxis protein [Afipia sp. Root123D2]|uniref:TIGR02302 family protein n=1 Tax=Afipia sp. Root123D2 TaxID=1736436 RepID=UPI0006F4EFA9|nr:TIGR02302 family protein [Afipia sp. Root123D2]KQW18913.1 chemotaxis protein [Afipia sp. Root123D2]
MSGPNLDPSRRAPDPEAVQRNQLAQALQRARMAIAWERLWPNLARVLTVTGLFLAASWAGAWVALPLFARIGGLVLFAALALASLLPFAKFRWPTREDALRRLDRGSGISHRPATALTDTITSQDPVSQALWAEQRARTLASLNRIRAGLPTPRLPLHDPWALRGLVAMLMVVTFIAAGEDRFARVAAFFDWNGALSPANVRVDAWISPPPYTSRPPIILSASTAKDAPPAESGAVPVPVGSTLIVRASGSRLDVSVGGDVSEVPVTEQVAQGTSERRFTIAGDGSAHIRAPSGHPQWTFKAVPDRAPAIALAKDPERQARGALQLSYKLDDDYGVTEAHAHFAAHPVGGGGSAAQPLYDAPDVTLSLPNARTRNGVGQTVKDLSEHPYAGTDVTLTLTAKDEAGNEGHSEPFELKLPERLFTKPLARALIEQRRTLALDANQKPLVLIALKALMIAPETFVPEFGQYLGLRSVAGQLAGSSNKDALRATVDSMWALAVAIEDGNITDVDKALRAAQDALKQALERGASDEEIKKLTENLRAALDNFMRQLAEQLRNNPQQLARPLDPNARVMRPQDLKNMIDRMERLSRSGDKDAARQLLDQMQQMLENLQMAQPGQGDSSMDQALNELGDLVRKQQQLRDRTFKEGQESRRGDRSQRDQNAMNGLQQDQQGLRERLQKLLEDMKRNGMMPGQQGEDGESDSAESGQQDGGNALGDAESAMGDADGQLGDGNAEGAVGSQGRALEALRKGAQNLAQSQQGEGQQGEGPGNRVGRQQSGGNDRDPLGRPLHGRDYGDDLSVKIPGEIDVQRVRRILEELRRRFSDPQRPQIELDYIERLLKDY